METDAYLMHLIDGKSLGRTEAEALMDSMMAAGITETRKASFLTALHFKGATPDEIIGFSSSLRKNASACRIPGLTDIVGTGGDGKNTINVSTASAIAASALGIRVAKHGNRGITSRHGSADFMKHIGYDFELGAKQPQSAIEKNGFLYVLAPLYNRSFAAFAEVRNRIGHRTVFNMMGPITNPFDPDYIVIGTADGALARPYAEVLAGRGKKGYVVHSADGLDEISPSAETTGYVVNGSIKEFSVSPEDFRFKRIKLDLVASVDPNECFRLTMKGLRGKDRNAQRFISMNTAPALVLNGLAASLEDGFEAAMNATGDGTVERQLQRLSGNRVEIDEAAR